MTVFNELRGAFWANWATNLIKDCLGRGVIAIKLHPGVICFLADGISNGIAHYMESTNYTVA